MTKMKHSKALIEIVKAIPSPMAVVLADAILEEKREQYEDILEIKRAAVVQIKMEDRLKSQMKSLRRRGKSFPRLKRND